MYRKYTIIAIGLLLALAVGLFITAQVFLGERTFDVRGRVAGFGTDGRTVFVEHEAVPGYMPAMTMPFTVRDTAALQRVEIGDAVAFRLHVTGTRSWITDLRPLPDDAVAEHPAAGNEPLPEPPTESPILREGETVPADLRLTSQSGAPFSLGDYRGQALVLTFIYTRCPLPDYCPLMSRRFASLQPVLRERFGEQAQLLSISFDPAYDTPAVLRDYAARYTEDLSTWTFATGTREQIARATSLFGVFPQDEGEQIIHNLTTVLVGPGGRVREIWRGKDWTPEEVLRAVEGMLPAEK